MGSENGIQTNVSWPKESYHQVDLAIAPPHFSQVISLRAYPQTGVNKAKNSLLNLSGLTEMVKSIDSRDSQLYIMEKFDEQNNDLQLPPSPTSLTGRPESIDIASLVSMEVLESHGKTSNGTNQDEAMHRVVEMNRILKDAERYLKEYSSNSPDNNTVNSFQNIKLASKTIGT